MRGNRRRDTAPELAIRRLLHAAGLRYRVDTRPLPDLNRRADLVFRRAKVAVFIDGCYWHGCPQHGTTAKTNADYWATKIGRNVTRDRETDLMLTKAGWQVVRLWEHEDPVDAARAVQEALGAVLAVEEHGLMTENKEHPAGGRQDRVEFSEHERSKGVQVIQTAGFPDGYTPPSASLTPPPPVASVAPDPAVAVAVPPADNVTNEGSGSGAGAGDS